MSKTLTITDYCCSTCEGNSWNLYLGHTGEEAKLIIVCSNEVCVNKKRLELQASDDDMIIWDEFNITGQGYDYIEEEEHCSEIN